MAKSKPKKPKRPKKPKPKDDCFITTACVQYYGLNDDCFELELLRSFRDGHLLKSRPGKKLVEEYNKVAPLIVSNLRTDNLREIILSRTFSRILKACNFISIGQYKLATQVYFRAVLFLMRRYNLDY